MVSVFYCWVEEVDEAHQRLQKGPRAANKLLASPLC